MTDPLRVSFARAHFPEDFTFGVATSAYQIEGHAQGGAGLTHWDTFAATPGNVVRAENGDRACDHYNRWPADLDLIRDGNFDAYRFSISWARVLPEGTGTPNEEGLDFYDKLIDGMLERRIDPYATLYHWELPSALAVRGGWQNPDIVNWFTDYSRLVMSRIGDRVKATTTINEPWCVAWLSHFMGLHAPGLRDIRAAGHAMHHVLKAHGSAVHALRADGLKNLGLVTNFEHFMPAEDTDEARKATALARAVYNEWFVGAVFQKQYPEIVLDGLAPHLPKGWESDFDTIAAPVDFLGVNYYTCRRMLADPTIPWPSVKDRPGDLPRTAMDWEVLPDGLYETLSWLHRDITGDTPIYITENGMASYDEVEAGEVPDAMRVDYLDSHFAAANRAIAEGVPLRGYFVWSLLDNYEWALGYDKRFGLVHVDFDSLERTPKASYQALKQALARN